MPMMHIVQIDNDNKLDYQALLLRADEHIPMIEKYLWRGDMLALFDDGEVKAAAVITDEGDGIFEIKNIATMPGEENKGYGSLIIQHIRTMLKGKGRTLIVGTGNTPHTLRFYEKNGFAFSHIAKDFFRDNYPSPIYDEGILLSDMIYLKQEL